MEFKLNKIDTSIRQRINETTKEGKVHGKKDFIIDKDKNKEEKQKFNFKKYDKKEDSKITVSAVKEENTKCDIITDDDTKGKHIDIRR